MSLFRSLITMFVVSFSIVASPSIAQTFDPTMMSVSDRTAFQAEIRAYLLEHPEVIFEAVDIYRAREEDEKVRAAQNVLSDMSDVLVNDGMSYIGGNIDGDVTIVEFIDYRCGYCRKAHDLVRELVKADGNIRLVVKEFPILGEDSLISARLAIAVLHKLGPDAYQEMSDFLITFNGTLTEKSMAAILSKFGHSPDEVIAHMDDAAVSGQIGSVHELARRLNITGTPTFVVGNEMIKGYVDLATMREIVAYHREQLN